MLDMCGALMGICENPEQSHVLTFYQEIKKFLFFLTSLPIVGQHQTFIMDVFWENTSSKKSAFWPTMGKDFKIKKNHLVLKYTFVGPWFGT